MPKILWVHFGTIRMLITDKVYKAVSLDEYNQAKKIAISNLAFNYTAKTDQEKWDLILPKLGELVPASQTRPQFIRALEAFQNARKVGNANLFNLSLHDCLDYFENFYFLYATEDKKFKLNIVQKSKLLEAIQDAMGTCETGINTRFEMVLQLYRTDLDWVTNCLSKQRYELVNLLHERCNAEYRIQGAYGVHVLSIMNQEAETAGFGLNIEHKIFDIHEHNIQSSLRLNVSKSTLQTYFKEHAPRVFKENYEERILETLSQHLLFELNELYQPDDGPWDTQGRTLVGADIAAFNTFIEDRLGFEGAGGELGEFNDAYTTFTLKPKAEFFTLLRGFVQQKLIRDGYHVPFDSLTGEIASDFKNLKLKNGVTVAALLEVNEAIVACNTETMKACHATLIKHADVVLQHPDLLLSRVKHNPKLLSVLPKALTNDAYFLKHAVLTVDGLLAEAIEAKNQAEMLRLKAVLVHLVKHDKAYLKHCSTDIGKALFQDFSRYQAVNKECALAVLKEEVPLGFSKTARFAQVLTPDELIDIINYRKQRNLRPLPYCNDVSILQTFQNELKAQGVTDWNTKGLAALKSQASERVRLGLDKPHLGGDSAVKYLAKHDFWFVAMARHQYAHTGQFKTLNQALFLLKHCAELLAEILWHLTKIMLTFVAGFVVAVYVCMLIDLIPLMITLPLFILGLSAFALSQLTANRDLAAAASIVSLVCACIIALDQLIIKLTIAAVFYQGADMMPVAGEFFDAMCVFFMRAFDMFFSDNPAYAPDAADDEKTQCDKAIAGLAVAGDDYSRPKLNVLMDLQEKIDTDSGPGEHLTKRYSFFCGGTEQERSFNEVVDMAPEDVCLFASA